MDNLRSHHVQSVREVFEAAHIQFLYLPPYSPDLNPIEKMWSKLKAILRKWKIRCADLLPDSVSKHPQVVTREQIQEALEKGKEIGVKPFADMLVFIYDYGDNWHFRITGSKGCSYLVEDGVVSSTELEKAIQKALTERHPVLIARDGDMLIEECGNVDGFVRFLKRVNLKPDKVVEQERDFIDSSELDCDWGDLDEDDLREAGYLDDGEEADYDVAEDGEDYEDEEDDLDENGMTRQELLNWAISQGWRWSDTTNINLL